MKNEMNLTMLTDFYEFTMMNGFFAEGYKDKNCIFRYVFQTSSRRRRFCHNGGR